jgi:DNA-binding NtrC family response regulator
MSASSRLRHGRRRTSGPGDADSALPDPTAPQGAGVEVRGFALRTFLESLPSAAARATGEQWPTLQRVQWEYIHAVLGSCNGNISEAARQLGLYRQSLQRMLRRQPPPR